MTYAGFWIRVLASLLDALIFMVPFAIIISVIVLAVGGTNGNPQSNVDLTQGLQGVGAIIFYCYLAFFWSSKYQATPGQMALGLKVVDAEGNRISLGRAWLRVLGYVVSNFILCIGFIMVAFTDKKRGLHDMIAGTLVIKKQSASFTPPAATVPGSTPTPPPVQ